MKGRVIIPAVPPFFSDGQASLLHLLRRFYTNLPKTSELLNGL
jgi:hypothetical protein